MVICLRLVLKFMLYGQPAVFNKSHQLLSENSLIVNETEAVLFSNYGCILWFREIIILIMKKNANQNTPTSMLHTYI